MSIYIGKNAPVPVLGCAVTGMSAYEVAVANGFSGTEEAWLASLKGETGPQGETGPAGTVDYDVCDARYVRHDAEQTLDSWHKTRARQNIGAVSQGDADARYLRYSGVQSLSDAQKAQARANIGAAKAENDPSFSGVTAQLLTLEDSGDEVSVSVSAENALGFTGANDHAVKLGNVDTPTDAYDAANKGYVDDAIEDNALMATKTQYFQASEKACARSNIGAEAARTDLSAAFAAQSDYATPQNFLAQQPEGRYFVDWTVSGYKIGFCCADNDQPGGSAGVLLSRSTLVAYNGTVFRYVCCKSAYGSADTAIYEQAGVSSSGTEFSKPVTVPAPTASGHAATKGYVDALLPARPTANGTYRLKCTVSGGTAVLSWEAEA